ncbi:MAG: type IV secretion system DotC family protein, partial [Deltaproteobacteria bacterium]|nr:type IV secretion system DotC family protein [Deltaproteobacteria bacterium]
MREFVTLNNVTPKAKASLSGPIRARGLAQGLLLYAALFLAVGAISWAWPWPGPLTAAPAWAAGRVDSQKELERLLSLKPQKDPLDVIKNQTLAQAAFNVAKETGARVRYAEILELIEPRAAELDDVFDFEPLVSRKGRLILEPPVISAIAEAVSFKGADQARDQGLTYRLVRSGRFLSAVPHWRGYLTPPLYEKLPEPDGVHGSLLPENGPERELWRQEILKGWSV